MKIRKVKWQNHPVLKDLELDFTKPDGTDAYMLIARPKGDMVNDEIEVGHKFSLVGFYDYGCHCDFSNCWPVMEMIRNAERL